ncbi:hypothetical protein STEG23_022362, partial [Scotinomys teguina]
MGRAGGGGPSRGPPPALLLLGATLVLTAGAVPAREAGSAIEAEELVRSGLTWKPRANDTREEAGLRATGEDETSWTAPGRELAAVGPGVGPEEALEASATVTGTAWLEADNPGLGGVTAETGSGDAQTLPATLQAPDEALGSSTVPPAIPEATEASGPPSPTTPDKPSPGSERPKESPLEVWLNLGGSTPDPPGPEPTNPLQGTLETQPASDIIDIDYFEGLDSEGRGADMGSFPGSPGASENHPDTEGETPSWSLLDLYDDFTPFDESDFYPTTSFYDDLEEEEEEEEDDKDAVGGGDLEDENDLLLPSQKPGVGPGTGQPTSRWHAVPPQHTLGMVPGSSISLRPRPGDPGRDLPSGENGTECRVGFVRHNGSCRSVCDLFPSYCHNGGQCYLVENIGAFCRCNTQDYIWHKGIRCESIITDFQVLCVAIGSAALVLLLLFMMTVFFAKKLYLLKTENTKLRRTNKFRTPSELHNDNFSLSTIAGLSSKCKETLDLPVSSPMPVPWLTMITLSVSPLSIFFFLRVWVHGLSPHCAGQEDEWRRLVLSFHPDDSSAPHKIQEALKSCLKEEESFNIQNSMSPKLEGGKGDQDDLEFYFVFNYVTCVCRVCGCSKSPEKGVGSPGGGVTSSCEMSNGKLTLLCDAKTDGSFLVHHFLSFYLKANCKICFVALVQSFSHYNIVGQKLGVSLTAAREQGQLVFLEGLKSSVGLFFHTQEAPHPLQFLREASAGNLRLLYEFVQDTLKPVDGEDTPWKYPVLLVDDLSVLLSLGMGAVTVLDFMQYCRAMVCCELK